MDSEHDGYAQGQQEAAGMLARLPGMLCFDVSLKPSARVTGPRTNPRQNIIVGLTRGRGGECDTIQTSALAMNQRACDS